MISKALNLTDPTEINREIESRIQLHDEMIGSLYPQIVEDEIMQLRKRYSELTGRYDHK